MQSGGKNPETTPNQIVLKNLKRLGVKAAG